MSEYHLHMLGDILYILFIFIKNIVAVICLFSTLLYFSDFRGRGHFMSHWLPWLQNDKMQNDNNTLFV